MARSILVDHVQNYRFRVAMLDEMKYAAVAATLVNIASTFLGSTFNSFARVSIPSVQIETEAFKEGVFPFQRRVIVGASVDTVLLESGVTMLDSDFWQWAVGAITGEAARKLLVVELLHRAQPNLPTKKNRESGNMLGTSDGGRSVGASVNTGHGEADLATATFRAQIPLVAKRWVFHQCFPVRVKVASDLDASNAEVSIAELELFTEWIEQYPITGV